MFTQFDIIVSFITLLYATFGLFKGAIKSILGLGKWYGAGITTMLLYPKVSEMVGHYMQPGMVANGIAVIATYIITLIALSIIIGIFLAALGGTVGGAGDKLLGAIVGITIGIIISSTLHYAVRVVGGGNDPAWLAKGSTYKVTSKGADKLQDYFKNVVNKMGTDMGILSSIDPSGEIANKIKEFEQATGSHVDYEKLKEAVRMMKADGMSPSDIKNNINIQDYLAIPSQLGQGAVSGASGQANGIVNETVKQVKKMQGSMPAPPVAYDDQE